MDFVFHVLFSPLPTPAIISLFAVAAATLFYLNTRPNPLHAPIDLKHQTLGIKVKSGETVRLRREGKKLKCIQMHEYCMC